jgi:hypothetical protein
MSGFEVPIIIALLTAGTFFTINSWADVEANPGLTFAMIADNIDKDPNRIILILNDAASKLLTADGRQMPIAITKQAIQNLAGKPNEITQILPDEIDDMTSIKMKAGIAVVYSAMMTSLAENLSQGDDAKDNVVTEILSASSRILNRGISEILWTWYGMPAQQKEDLIAKGFTENSDIFFGEIFTDLAINITPSLHNTIWKDADGNVLKQWSELDSNGRYNRQSRISRNIPAYSEAMFAELGWQFAIENIGQSAAVAGVPQLTTRINNYITILGENGISTEEQAVIDTLEDILVTSLAVTTWDEVYIIWGELDIIGQEWQLPW